MDFCSYLPAHLVDFSSLDGCLSSFENGCSILDAGFWILDTRKKFYRGERKSKDDFGGVSLQSDVQYYFHWKFL